MKPFDIQVNGYAGVDFCSMGLTAGQFLQACEALRSDGVSQFLATVITDSIERLEAKLSNMVKLREANPLIKEMVAGFHIEGPFMSSTPGFAGAHPPEAMRQANLDDAKRLYDACSGLARLVTIAPECDPGYQTIDFFASQGVCVSAGHCDPSLEHLRGAIDHGLSMVTHFGNGCPVTLPRHNNVLQRFLHLREHLWFCFIPDGVHIEFFALKNYLDFVGVDRSIMVTDVIGAAKIPPGTHELSGIRIEVDKNGIARRPGSQNLAGSTITLPGVIANLRDQLFLSPKEISQLIDLNPRAAIAL